MFVYLQSRLAFMRKRDCTLQEMLAPTNAHQKPDSSNPAAATMDILSLEAHQPAGEAPLHSTIL